MNFFEQISHFWEPFAWIMSESLISLFFTEQKERFKHGCSFVKSDKSNSLMVAHITEGQERFTHSHSFLKSDEIE